MSSSDRVVETAIDAFAGRDQRAGTLLEVNVHPLQGEHLAAAQSQQGGQGAMLEGLLAVEPTLRGIVADRPEVAAAATEHLATAGLSDRAWGVPADFFVAVPTGGDIYVLSNVLHDWDDDEALTILRRPRCGRSGCSTAGRGERPRRTGPDSAAAA